MVKKKLQNQDSAVVALLRQGKDSPFWLTLKKLIQEDKIDILTHEILEGDYFTDVAGEKHLLTEKVEMTRRELCILERSLWVELLKYPDRKISLDTITSIENDPDE